MTISDNIALICGALFLAAAGVMKIVPPRQINSLYGYRTSRSMRSREHWKFAQQFSVWRMFEAALFLLIIGLVMECADSQVRTVVGLVSLLAVPVYLIVRTERALNQKFPS